MPTSIDPLLRNAIAEIKEICTRPESKSQFFPFGGEGYKSSVRHYLESSCEIAACAVQPGTLTDLCEIMKVIKKFRVRFAVKGGGHATNPHFSSTTGIQISMCRFNTIELKKNSSDFLRPDQSKHSIVHVGAGCLFDEVYREVVPHGLNIVGGSSIGGVGIAGWLLGGGYSMKTNQHGLGIDNVLGMQIVLPSGEEKEVDVLSEGEDKELFEAVKGGGNNFGIVTKFTIRAHDQTGPIFGGLLVYQQEQFDDVKIAIASFSQQSDPKASLVAAFRYYSNNSGMVKPMLTVQCFYDGPKPTTDPFAEFLAISHKIGVDGGDSVGHQFTRGNFSTGVSGRSQTERMPQKLQEYFSYVEFEQQLTLAESVLDAEFVNAETIPQVSRTSLYARFLALPMNGVEENPGLFWPVVASASHTEDHSTTKPDGSLGSDRPSIPLGGFASVVMTDSATTPQGSVHSMLPSTGDTIKRGMVGVGENPRGRWGNVMIDIYTKEVIDEIARQASEVSEQMPNHGGKRVVIDMWPFTRNMFDNSTPAAWPHTRGMPNGPILAYVLWEGSEYDQFWIGTMKNALNQIKHKVNEARGPDAKPLPVYLNTTLDSTTVEEIYGENLSNLSKLRKKFDPERVMDLTGGFRIPHPREASVSW